MSPTRLPAGRQGPAQPGTEPLTPGRSPLKGRARSGPAWGHLWRQARAIGMAWQGAPPAPSPRPADAGGRGVTGRVVSGWCRPPRGLLDALGMQGTARQRAVAVQPWPMGALAVLAAACRPRPAPVSNLAEVLRWGRRTPNEGPRVHRHAGVAGCAWLAGFAAVVAPSPTPPAGPAAVGLPGATHGGLFALRCGQVGQACSAGRG